VTDFNSKKYLSGKRRKVLFVVPPQQIGKHYGRLASFAARMPWMGMAYLAGAAKAAGHQVKVVDCEAENIGFSKLKEIIAEFMPDVIGCSSVLTNVDRCVRTMQIAKKVSPAIVTVIGGPQATIFPEQIISERVIDIVVVGEGEITMCEVLYHMDTVSELEMIQGVWIRSNNRIIKNQKRELIKDLDTIPFPALDLFPLNNYKPAAYNWGRKIVPMLSSRGCTFKCSFCEVNATFQGSFRYHSADRIISDINSIIDLYNADSIQFWDDIFTGNKKRVHELCDKIIKYGRKFKWSCCTRTDRIDIDLLVKMKDSGCYLILFGCESGNQKLLDLLNKNLTVEKNLKGIEMAKKAGIKTLSTFMLGLPTETRDMTLKTIEFAAKSSLDYAVFPLFEPYPGTEIYNDALETGYFIKEDGRKVQARYTGEKLWVPNGRERRELEQMSFIAMKRFYLRLHIISSMLIDMSANIPLKRLFALLYGGINYFVSAQFKKVKYGTRY